MIKGNDVFMWIGLAITLIGGSFEIMSKFPLKEEVIIWKKKSNFCLSTYLEC